MAGRLQDYELTTFSHAGFRHQVFRAGSGPAVVLVPEIPGIHPGVLDLARRLRQAGFTVYLPSLFGEPGAPSSTGRILRSIAHVCVSREFRVLADRTSPIVTWLRALAAEAHAECGGPGVGAIGMCLTGGFALAMAVEPAVLAPVLSQPALPAPVSARRRASLGLDRADLEAVRERARRGLGVVGLRFTQDRACPAERFARLRRELDGAFTAIEIDSSPGNPHGIRQTAHAVLTVDLVDRPGHPTREALDRVLRFLEERLRAGPGSPAG